MIKGIHGLNIAVRDLEIATAKYEKIFDVKSTHVGEDGFAFPGLRGAAFDIGGFNINLITSTSPDTSVGRFLEKNGEGMFLLSVWVEDIDTATEDLRNKGVEPLLTPSARGAFGAVNFVHPKQMHGVQLEIFQLP